MPQAPKIRSGIAPVKNPSTKTAIVTVKRTSTSTVRVPTKVAAAKIAAVAKATPIAKATSTSNALLDKRVNCHSIMTMMSTRDYLNLVERAYDNRGGIEFQREKLRTTSAIRIRRRMVEDIANGAVLPPVVVGVVLGKNDFGGVEKKNTMQLVTLVQSLKADRISIIDGMQRTTALREALSADPEVGARQMRVEFWVSESTNSLIYRMLVLNTGQVPWNLRSQVEVVFRSLILEIENNVASLEVLQQADGRRRSKGGQFQADDLIELFLVFGARKEKIDIRERLADEFTKLDFIEAASDIDFTTHFCQALDALVQIDIAFDRYKRARGSADRVAKARFENGKDLFASQPASVGLITAIALAVFGRPGMTRSAVDQTRRLQKLNDGVAKLKNRLNALPINELENFLAFQTLNEAITRGKSGLKLGDTEREFFLTGFQVMIEEDFGLTDMAPCWRAY
jgi:hypothetical protein